MYKTTHAEPEVSGLFHVKREKKVTQIPVEVEEEEEEPVIIKPKRVKQRLPGVKLLRKLANLQIPR